MRETTGSIDNGHQAIDLAAGLDRVMGDRAMYLRVLGRFRADYHDVARRLRAALAQDDGVLVQRIIHTLKGAAAMIEARLLRQLSLDVELVLREGAPVQQGMVDRLEQELARVLAELDAILAAPVAALAAAPASLETVAHLRAMLDIGDGRAPDAIEAQRASLLAALGPERMQALDAAVRVFDFERAVAVLDGSPGV